MKIFRFIYLVAVILILSFQSGFAAQVSNDEFENGSLDGWSGGYTWNNNGWMYIASDNTASKSFSFGVAYANQTATVSFQVTIYRGWERRGRWRDYLEIRANGSLIRRYENLQDGVYTGALAAPIDSNGNLTLSITPNTTNNSEEAGFNYIRIDADPIPGTPPAMAAIPDQSATEGSAFSLDLSSFTTEDDGDTVTYALSCTPTVDGVSLDSATGLFDGTPTTAGTYDCSAYASDKDGASTTRSFKIIVSDATPPFVCSGSYGLLGNYYNNRNHASPIVLSRVDSNIDFAWGSGSPDSSVNNDDFSIQWEGTIYIPEDGEYIFSIAHDDAFRLEINGNTIYDSSAWTGGDTTFRDASPVTLTTGSYPITVKFVEWGGGAYAKLAWRNDGSISSQTIIPSINFCTTEQPLVATDNNYTTSPGLTLTGNFITDDSGDGQDTGLNIQANTTPTTAPTKGTLTINSDGSFTYVSDLNVTGTDFFDYTITDIRGNTATATVLINLPVAPPATMAAFQQRYINNLKGNIRVIGNTVLLGPDNGNSNAQLVLTYIDIDSDGNTFNSSSADINTTEANVDITKAKVVWAGLYWQGYLHNDDGDTGADTQFNNFSANINVANTRILNTIQNQSVLLKVNNGSYISISPHALGTDREYFIPNRNYVSWKYAAFADVTSVLQGQAPNATYTVANIPTRSGQTSSSIRDGLGNYGAWSLVVVYDNTPEEDEKTRNVSIYDGYVVLSAANNPSQTINVGGFKTPKIAPNGVDSTLSIFAGEGDRYILGDFAKITNEDGAEFDLPDTSGAGSYFASVIEGVPLRNPVILNNNGIDIHTTQVGTVPGGIGAIQKNHTSASITLGTTQDTFMPSLITFATELYVPEICYDYTIQLDGFDITDSGNDPREFRTTNQGELSVNIAIKSKEGDFDFENSKLSLELVPSTNTGFTEAFYAPNNVNTFVPAIYADGHTNTTPVIALGEYPSTNGGTIKALQRYYSKFKYQFSANQYNGKFEFDLNTTLDFGSGPVPILLSSKSGTIKRCTLSDRYDPTYGSFNVERHNSAGTPEEKYPLYTQIVGRDFDFDVVAYKKDPAPAYSSEMSLSGYTVDVELISVRTYNDQNETFACNNPEPSIIQTLKSNGNKQIFARFSGTTRVDMSSMDIQTDTALRSAAFRIWYIVDENNTIIPHNCSDPSDNACFQNLYDTHLATTDTTLQAGGTLGFCSVSTLGAGGCSSYTNTELGTSGCYACLRDHFARAVCSRDNFAIRPASYRLTISDTNESKTPPTKLELASNDSTGTDPVSTLAAGYQYMLDGLAASFVGDTVAAKRYNRIFDGRNPKDLSSVLQFEDKPACFDKNSTEWGVAFNDGKIFNLVNNGVIDYESGNLLSHLNAGKYVYSMHDSNWTIVDQKRYPFKTFPNVDDCEPSSSKIPSDINLKPGCDINSTIKAADAPNLQDTYNSLHLKFQPYKFSLADINFSTSPANQNYLFMTDFDDPYYQTSSSFSRTMAAIHEGNVTALGKTNIITTNFTDGCAAEDIIIVLNRDTNDTEENLETLYDIKIQQYLSYGSNVDTKTSFDDKQEGKDANLTLNKAAFEDAVAQGTARVRIYTNFKKPAKEDIPNGSEGIDPVMVNYLEINATSIDANSSAHMSTHIPKGTKNFDRNITFVYGRIAPNKKLYVERENNWKKTPLYVNIYCSIGSLFCADRYDLNSSSLSSEVSGNWYQASNLFQPGEIGTSDLNVTHYGGGQSDPRISHGIDTDKTHIENVGYDHVTASQTDINVTIQATDLKPTVVRVEYFSDPWLRYEDDFYDVRFMPKPTEWTGFGKTGHVVDDDINTYKTKRVEW